ncbi:glycosyltransferase family protein [Methylobacterium flocculans]|uniref:glycosyltransferase family protein n=1 Tax=Methylobacterium flocculans TaxID=2984843 RepID=UPI0021F33889|nr:glycosyltransferase [Methylobacterium sp. FF17]
MNWARERGVPTIFHIDDDLLDIPIELGAAKQALHMHPDRLATIRYLLAETTLAYCSTPALRQRLFGDGESSRVVAGSLYCAHRVRRAPVEPIRSVIGYMGTDHSHDLAPVVPALVRLLTGRPEVTFEIFGSTPMPDALKLFGDRVRTIPPVGDYGAFMDTLEGLGWTIGICALAQTPFNAVKADTKWVEYTACGFAVVASRGTVYDACCADGCGLLVDGEAEWFAAFERLLEDGGAHRAQVERAQEKLRRDYSPERLAEQVLSVFARAQELAASAVAPTTHASSAGTEADAPPADERDVDGFHVDAFIDDKVVGWAWSPQERGRAEGLPLEIWCGDVRLGWNARRMRRSDVDAHVGDSSHSKGFELPIGGLHALFHLLDDAPGLLPSVRLDGRSYAPPSFRAHRNDLASFRTLRTADGRDRLHVADLWWANSRLLKVRSLDAPAVTSGITPTVLRVYQLQRAPTGTLGLIQVDEQELSPHAAIYPVGMRSAYMPLLVVGCTAAGEIAFIDLVPFPSLLRGGPHEAEVSALGDESGSLSDLRRLSDTYLTDCIGGENHPAEFALAGLDIDLSTVIGTEPIFDPSLREWLAAVPRIPVGATNIEARVDRDLGDRGFADHAVAQLKRPDGAASRPGRLRLSLGNAAVPTIAGLVSREPLPSASAFAPHIVTDPAAPTKRWFIALPEGGPLAAVTELGRIARQSFPALEGRGDDPQPDPHADRLLPLAILFRDLGAPTQADLISPVPRDQPTILPQIGPSAPSISVLVLVEQPEHNLQPLLASLAAQAAPNVQEIIVGAAAHDSKLDSLRQLVADILPGLGQVVSDLDTSQINSALNVLASRATGDVLVLLDQSMILHDPRTLDTLARLATLDGTGTVGCLQIRARTPAENNYVLKSAGLFPGRVDFAGPPALSLKELDSIALLPMAIYPVAANLLTCMAISMYVWREVGGLKDATALSAQAGVTLSTRAVEAGYTNLCTSLLSVTARDFPRSPRGVKVFEATRLSAARLLPAVRASTLVRSF